MAIDYGIYDSEHGQVYIYEGSIRECSGGAERVGVALPGSAEDVRRGVRCRTNYSHGGQGRDLAEKRGQRLNPNQ